MTHVVSRTGYVLLGLTSAAAAATAVLAYLPQPETGHRLLHINCPPGSHASRTTENTGQKIQEARDNNLKARSLIANHANAPK